MRLVDIALTFVYGLLILAGVLWIASCAVHAQALAPSIAIVAGSALDLGTTLHALQGTGQETNPVLSHGGTASLVATKVALTALTLWGMRRLSAAGHPKMATWMGYLGGIGFGAIALHNASVR